MRGVLIGITFILLFIFVLINMTSLAAADLPAKRARNYLPGDGLLLDEAMTQAGLVVITKFEAVGPPGLDSLKKLDCIVKTSVISVLLGQQDRKDANFNLTYNSNETPPLVGQSYIVLFKVKPRNVIVFLKMLENTDKNIALVKKIIADSAATKRATTNSATTQ